MIDSHCHLNLDDFEEDFEDVVVRAVGDGVSAFVNIGYDRESMRRTLELLEKYPFFYGVVGVHPHDASTLDDSLYSEIEAALKHPRVVAVGEIGLDFYRDHSPRDVQRDVFKSMISLARKENLPVVIHCRDAFNDVVETLAEAGSGYRGIFHAFAGDVEHARRVMEMGFHIGIGGVVTYRNSPVSQTVKSLPLDCIVLETDSPYLTPHPYRGRRNEPSYVTHVARAVASALGVSQYEVDATTSENVFEALGIREEVRPSGVYRFGDTIYIQTTVGVPQGLEGFEGAEEVREAVICGFGDPLDEMDRVMNVARWAADKGLRVRVNTSGLANVTAGRDVTRELSEFVDEIVVTFFGTSASQHERMAMAGVDEKAFGAMCGFVRSSVKAGMDTVCEFIAAPKFQAEPCRAMARDLGAQYDIRMYRS
jgi:TatD DNase family protein